MGRPKNLVGVKGKTVPGWYCMMTAAMAVMVVGKGGGRGCWPGWLPRLLAWVVAEVVVQGCGQGCWDARCRGLRQYEVRIRNGIVY